MAASVNKVILVGNLGKDPEFKSLQDGSRVANITLATSESWTDRASGERKERTEWHRVVILGNDHLVGIAERYLRKGSKVFLEGKLQTRKWTDQQGQDRFTTEIMLGRFGAALTLLDNRSDGGDDAGSYRAPTGGNETPAGYGTSGRGAATGTYHRGATARQNVNIEDDQIPF